MSPEDTLGGPVLEPDVVDTGEAAPVDASAAPPNLERTGEELASMKTLAMGVLILAVLAIMYTLYFARDFLLPIVFAVLLNFLFSPLVRALARARVPTPLGAAVVMLALLGALGGAGYELSGPIQRLAADAPQIMSAAEAKVGTVLKPLERASRSAEQVASAATQTTDGTTGARRPQAVVLQGPSLVTRAFGTTQRALASILEVVILLYFLLAAGDLFLQKLVKVLPRRGEKKVAVQIARETESSISTFLVTTATVNVCEGLVVTGIMYLWGMPNPFLWGALVTVFEFIPYIGSASLVIIFLIAALTTFDSVGHALLIPASYLLVNIVQGQVVSPLLLGYRLSLNPVALFVGLAFWFWVWGILGAFLAVPMLATFKIFCDHIDGLSSIGEFLGKRDDDERRATVR